MSRALLEPLVQTHLLDLQPYATARHEFQGQASVWLDANENPFGESGYNRYPDPLQSELRQLLATQHGLRTEQLFTALGSDEVIDLLCRLVGRPGTDEVIICPPTYGVYAIAAGIQRIKVREVPLLPNFQLDVAGILTKAGANSKILWLCSPNNPTGNALHRSDMEALLQSFPGLVVVDEAYIDFAPAGSTVLPWLDRFPRLVVLRTLSKAYGLAGLRLGFACAHPWLVGMLQRIKAPYNVPDASQQAALRWLAHPELLAQQRELLLSERERLAVALESLASVVAVYPSAANFLLVKFVDASAAFAQLLKAGIVVRDRSRMPGLTNCLRISVGTPTENDYLIQTLQSS